MTMYLKKFCPPKDILIKGKLRRKGKELNKKVIAYIKYNIETETHYIANDDYPFLNLYYRGHCYNKKMIMNTNSKYL